ncbi:MAG: TlpA disulfide reductase family protein [Candidatus Aminicenantales bacterium]|jgi:thiol-disulfide isomerase/thioredoxin
MIPRSAALFVLALGAALLTASPADVEVRICLSLEEATGQAGRPVLLVFFSTECPSCYDDLFEARYLVEKAGFDVTVIGVFSGPRDRLRAFLEKFAWTLPVVLDRRKALFRKFRVDMVPYKALLSGGEAVYRDDPYKDYGRRREDLERCLKKMFSR